MIRFLIGQALLILAVLLGITLIGGRVTTWLHPAVMAFIFVLVVPVFAALSAYSFQDCQQAFADALRPSAASPSNAASVKIWKLLEFCVYCGGVLGFLTGLIITFTFFSSDLQGLGLKFAATLVAPFYSVILAMACRVLAAKVKRSLSGRLSPVNLTSSKIGGPAGPPILEHEAATSWRQQHRA